MDDVQDAGVSPEAPEQVLPAEVPGGCTRYVVSAFSVVKDAWVDVYVVDLPQRTKRSAAVGEAIRAGKIEVGDDPTRLKVRVLDELNAGDVPIRFKEDNDPTANLLIG